LKANYSLEREDRRVCRTREDRFRGVRRPPTVSVSVALWDAGVLSGVPVADVAAGAAGAAGAISVAPAVAAGAISGAAVLSGVDVAVGTTAAAGTSSGAPAVAVGAPCVAVVSGVDVAVGATTTAGATAGAAAGAAVASPPSAVESAAAGAAAAAVAVAAGGTGLCVHCLRHSSQSTVVDHNCPMISLMMAANPISIAQKDCGRIRRSIPC